MTTSKVEYSKLERTEVQPQPDQFKLSPADREAVRRLLTEGKTMRQVAEHFGVSHMAIWRIAENHPRKGGSPEGKKGDDA
jgi:transposase-like protein